MWYLLVPPYIGLAKFDARAPLARWYEVADFRSLSDCQRYRASTLNEHHQQLTIDPSGSRAYIQLFTDSECISSNDSRRAGN
jgi:hypothetical protein